MRGSVAELGKKTIRHASWKTLGALSRSPHPVVTAESQDGRVLETRGPSAIEPNWGLIITEPWGLHDSSFDSLQDKPTWRYATPSPLEWYQSRRAGQSTTEVLEDVVSLRHLYEWNYYHFFMDMLPKLMLMEKFGVDLDRPIVVGPSCGEQAYAREAFELGALAGKSWHIQERDTYVRAKTVTFAYLERPYACTELTYEARAKFVFDAIASDVTRDLPEAHRRIFLARRPPYGRLLVNADEVESALSAAGFEIVDSAGMSLVEQIQLFRQTRVLIAVHGAGMLNMIFRQGLPMQIMEICAEDFASEDMRRMADQLGFEFHRESHARGSDEHPIRADIHVDVARLMASVEALGENPD